MDRHRQALSLRFVTLTLAFGALGCADDGSTEADRVGIAAVCSTNDDCATYELEDGRKGQLACLTAFKGGYCGLAACKSTADCPGGSVCVAHDDGKTYCFRSCVDKAECNSQRTAASEANCSSSFTWATPADDNGGKACIPPSAGAK